MKNYPNDGPSRSEQSLLLAGVMSPELYTERHLAKRDDVQQIQNVPGRAYRMDTESNRQRAKRRELAAIKERRQGKGK